MKDHVAPPFALEASAGDPQPAREAIVTPAAKMSESEDTMSDVGSSGTQPAYVQDAPLLFDLSSG